MGGYIAHIPNLRWLFPCFPGLLIAIPLLIQRVPYKRRTIHKIRLIAGAAIQCLLVAMLACPGTSPVARLLSGTLLLAYVAAGLFDFMFFRTMRHPPGEDMLLTGLRERHNIRALVRGYIHPLDRASAGVLFLAVLLPVAFPASPAGWSTFLIGAVGLGGLAIMGRRGPPPGEALGSVYRAAWHIRKVLWDTRRKTPIRPRKPFPVRNHGAPPVMNIITILNESLSLRQLRGPGVDAMPHTDAFLKEQGGRIFQFPIALANSGLSDISYPTLLTGLSPNQTWERFDRCPLIWAAAKNAGYTTALYSSWNMAWAALRRMIIDSHIDAFVEPGDLDAPLINDLGMDDRVLNEHFIEYIKSARAPFFAAVAYNAPHIPCLVDPSVTRYDLNTRAGRYLNSLTVLDGCLKKLFDTLRETGLLENTAIFFISDHGEVPAYFDNPGVDGKSLSPRVGDLCEDIITVPYWMYLPEGAASPEEIAALRVNQSRVISNLDYFPTALTAMKLKLEPHHKKSLHLAGDDLFQPLPEKRRIPCVNTNDLRPWSTSPVALADGDELLIHHDVAGTYELLNLREPDRGDLWPATPPAQKEKWMQRLVEAGLRNSQQ